MVSKNRRKGNREKLVRHFRKPIILGGINTFDNITQMKAKYRDAWRLLYRDATPYEIVYIMNEFFLDPDYKCFISRPATGQCPYKKLKSSIDLDVFKKGGPPAGHHRKPKSLGGVKNSRNMSMIAEHYHNAWHLLHAGDNPYKIVKHINAFFLDFDYKMYVIRIAPGPCVYKSKKRSKIPVRFRHIL